MNHGLAWRRLGRGSVQSGIGPDWSGPPANQRISDLRCFFPKVRSFHDIYCTHTRARGKYVWAGPQFQTKKEDTGPSAIGLQTAAYHHFACTIWTGLSSSKVSTVSA